jgi:ubiquitin carboxyl-terminal hydrolase 48
MLLSSFSCLRQPSIVVSQQALNTFLSRPLDKRTNGPIDQIDQTECSSNGQTSLNCVKSNGNETSALNLASFMEGDISVEEILCSHGRLDPGKVADMKRIDHVRPNHADIVSY